MRSLLIPLVVCLVAGCADKKVETSLSKETSCSKVFGSSEVALGALQDSASKIEWKDARGVWRIDQSTCKEICSLLLSAKYRKDENSEKKLCLASILCYTSTNRVAFSFYTDGAFLCNKEWYLVENGVINKIVKLVEDKITGGDLERFP